jgi:hypothetical protein
MTVFHLSNHRPIIANTDPPGRYCSGGLWPDDQRLTPALGFGQTVALLSLKVHVHLTLSEQHFVVLLN